VFNGTITTFAGSGGRLWHTTWTTSASTTPLWDPWGLAIDRASPGRGPDGSLLFTDASIHVVMRIYLHNLTMVRVAGAYSAPGALNGDALTTAQFNRPLGIVVAPDGAVLIADCNSHKIRVLRVNGSVADWVGNGAVGFVNVQRPTDVAYAHNPMSVHIALPETHSVRSQHYVGAGYQGIVGTGSNATVGVDGFSSLATQVNGPVTVTVDWLRSAAYFAESPPSNRIRRWNPASSSRIVMTVAGIGEAELPRIGVPSSLALETRLHRMACLRAAADGTLYITFPDIGLVHVLLPNGTLEWFAGSGSAGGDGPLQHHSVRSPFGIDPPGPEGIAVVASDDGHVRLLLPNGTVRTLAGSGVVGGQFMQAQPITYPALGAHGEMGRVSAAVMLRRASSVANRGRIFMLDEGNQRLLRTSADGTSVDLVSGVFRVSGWNCGSGSCSVSGAQLSSPSGLAFGGAAGRTLGIADDNNHRIRILDGEQSWSACACMRACEWPPASRQFMRALQARP